MTTIPTRGVDTSRLMLKIGADEEQGNGDMIVVENPATGETIGEVRSASDDQVNRAVQSARAALRNDELGSPAERSAYLHSLADVLESHADEILDVVVNEVGTPISTARDLHLGTPVEILRWLADAALTDRTVDLGANVGRGASNAIVEFRPVGVAAGITAYNYPILFNSMKLGSALAAGCPIVLLSSPLAPLSSLLFGSLLTEAGVPSRAVSVLAGGVPTATSMIASPDIAKVSFTGSVSSGEAVMRAAARGVRDVVLELGGKTAAILLPSADMEGIVRSLHQRYLRNAGQGCASPTRLLVPSSQLARFQELSREVFQDVVVGDPWDEKTLVGPVISREHRERVRAYISGAVNEGGSIVARGHVPGEDRGWYVEPTLIGGLGSGARINQEEVFGPVASVIAYDNVAEAIEIANDTKYGLHASVFGDLEQGKLVAQKLKAGTLSLNGGGRVRPEAPNGGWNASGIGRERGDLGIREYLEPVTIQWPV